MQLLEYLQLDLTDENNCKTVFTFVFDELEKLKSSDFAIDNIHTINGVLSKFIELAKNYGIDPSKQLVEYGEQLLANVVQSQSVNSSTRITSCIIPFEKIVSSVTICYGKIVQKNITSHSYSDLEILYNPDQSNKDEALALLKQVRSLIENDNELPNKLKKSILSKIDNLIDSLNKKKCNWTQYFGKAYQLVIVLGAIGSFSGGVAGWVAVKEAKSKLIQATQIIESTSINQQFNIQYNISNSHYLLEENKLDTPNVNSTLALPGKQDD